MNENHVFENLSEGISVCRSDIHSFGTDAFLLTGFCCYREKDRVVDLGTGCGIIPLLMHRHRPPKEVFAVDIQPLAIEQLRLGLSHSTKSMNITPICADLRVLWDDAPRGQVDLITCNPPYKANGAGILSAGTAQQIARHEIECTLDDICAAAETLLNYHGRLCMCCRPERLADVVAAMQAHKIEPKRLRFVCKNPESAPWLFLIEGKKCAKPFLQVEPSLFVRDGNDMTSEAAQICHFGEKYL